MIDKPFGPEDPRWDDDRIILRQWLAQELQGHYQPRLAKACEHIASWARQEPLSEIKLDPVAWAEAFADWPRGDRS